MDDGLLDGPRIDVEPVGKIAEAGDAVEFYFRFVDKPEGYVGQAEIAENDAQVEIETETPNRKDDDAPREAERDFIAEEEE